MSPPRPVHHVRTEDGKGGCLTWCNKFLLFSVHRGQWTETVCQVDCIPCVAAYHAELRRQGKRPMRDTL